MTAPHIERFSFCYLYCPQFLLKRQFLTPRYSENISSSFYEVTGTFPRSYKNDSLKQAKHDSRLIDVDIDFVLGGSASKDAREIKHG